MAYLASDPADFTADFLDGFAQAHASRVVAVDGGIMRRKAAPPGRVAVVIGGGTGHFPAFAGLVGEGIADGAVIGNVFASPSWEQVYSVAAAADTGAGVLLSYGNYAGDVLNFDAAQAKLRADGRDCRTVLVTDDVASAPADMAEARRGIAGDLAVFKIAGAAAARGDNLGEVVCAAERANDRTRTIGVAFSGCTLPGDENPLFVIDPGTMAVGMGIHGEPGIATRPRSDARSLAELLVGSLVAESPAGKGRDGSPRVAVIVNGLGSVKYEELYLLYGHVAQLLHAAGLAVVDPEVGEFVTSFEMAGVSLTLLWLDDALEELWRAGCDTPAFRKAPTVGDDLPSAVRRESVRTDQPTIIEPGSVGSRRAAADLVQALEAVALLLDGLRAELGALDAVAGDGDHGIGMARGARAAYDAAVDAANAGAGLSTALSWSGRGWSRRAGGTSGALWGIMIHALAEHFDDDVVPSADDIVSAARAALNAVTAAGHAVVGDKTLVDALAPYVETLSAGVREGLGLGTAALAAADAATRAAQGTASLAPKVGRARPLAQRSIGHPDPGAVSFAYVASSFTHALLHGEGPNHG